MRWLCAGLMFAAFVAIAIWTATVRAENSIRRHEIERQFIAVRDLKIEKTRLETALLDRESERRLARAHWRHVDAEFERRVGGQQ